MATLFGGGSAGGCDAAKLGMHARTDMCTLDKTAKFMDMHYETEKPTHAYGHFCLDVHVDLKCGGRVRTGAWTCLAAASVQHQPRRVRGQAARPAHADVHKIFAVHLLVRVHMPACVRARENESARPSARRVPSYTHAAPADRRASVPGTTRRQARGHRLAIWL